MVIIPYELIGPWLIGAVVSTTLHVNRYITVAALQPAHPDGHVVSLKHADDQEWGLWVASSMYDDPDHWSLLCVDPMVLACLVEKKDTYDRGVQEV